MKVYFETYGCTLNISDTEVMKGLASKKHVIVDSPEKADVVVINTCTVKGPTENKILRRIKEFEKSKKIVVAGCMPQADRKKYKNYFAIGTYNITKINDILDKIEKNERVEQYLNIENEIRLNQPKIRKNKYVEIVPICRGCMNNCYYCKTKFARGNLFSYEEKEILNQVKNAVNDGIKEVWLTSQDNGCYGFDKNTNLAKLLREVSKIKGDFKVRVGMMNPQHIKKFLPELVNAYSSEKIYKFIHVPVQSGSNKILKLMNRKHTAEDFLYVVNAFRKRYPEITISTDIIVGYPGETERDFNKTLETIKKSKPDIINISRFWPRPGTIAAKMKQVDINKVKDRVKRLASLFNEIALEKNKKYLNRTYNIFIDEVGKNSTFKGRNENYKQVIVKGKNLLGKSVNVKITAVSPWDLKGTTIKSG